MKHTAKNIYREIGKVERKILALANAERRLMKIDDIVFARGENYSTWKNGKKADKLWEKIEREQHKADLRRLDLVIALTRAGVSWTDGTIAVIQ